VLEHAHGLTDDALAAIEGLEARCRDADGGRLKLEWGALRRRDPALVNDLLSWDGDTLVGFAGRYAFGGQVPEATGMVDPASRGRGVGTELLGEMLALCRSHGDKALLLVTARSCPAGKALAERAGGRFEHAEHAMVLRQLADGGAADPTITLRPADEADVQAITVLLEAGFGGVRGLVLARDPDEAMLVAERDGAVIATMRVIADPGTKGIYGFVVDPALRGRGIGRDLLRRVCAQALADGCETVHLEVSVENDHALGLYTSVGFEREATEDYYAFDLATAPT
jgi:ribosomal protein S18 acetylase RimI-like enzyme